ncbi:S-adenosyl-L-methionine-dependent methyltransferase, partial [Basidiobolus meristosporus CBS 931.73]
MGYWENTMDFQQACKALVSRVAKAADLGVGERILDVGYGCGDQDIYLQEEFNLSRIVGFTLEPVQQIVAKQRVAESCLQETIQLELGDAARISHLLASKRLPTTYDRVISIDSAYHYRTRAAFLGQAFEHLRSGGSIGLADIILARKPQSWWGQTILKLVCTASEIPLENMVNEAEYRSVLESIGYTQISLVPIEDQVFPGLAGFIERQEKIFDGLVVPTLWMKLSVMKWLLRYVHRNQWLHFVVVSAKKP